ncbi:unnamed protein product, partial [Aphanomyces euteiches]
NDIKEQQEMYMLLGERVEDLEAKIEDLIKTRSEVTKFKERNKLKTLKFRSLVSPTMKHLQW